MNSIKRVGYIQGVPKPRASYSNLTRAGDFIFIAGQVAINPETGEIPVDLKEQLRLVFENVKKLVESEGGTLADVVKTTAYLADPSYHEEYDRLYRSYFREGYPARSTVQARLMHPDFKVEVEAIAYIPQGPRPHSGP
ncbi:RidA family protein [Candidatus Bathyarchaeota archaeon]|nr:RidA family protein [Candidatus Bathyarchaeota archaeon]